MNEAKKNLARMPRPWDKKVHRISLAQYEATLKYWAGKLPRIAKVQKRGESVEGLPIYLFVVTDNSVPAADKQVCLLTGLATGNSMSALASLMRLTEWLLSDDSEAVETRRKQIVLLMPLVNPWGYSFVSDPQMAEPETYGIEQGTWQVNSQHIDPYTGERGKYWNLESLDFDAPEKCPEIMAVKSVVDEYRPDVHADFHGVMHQYNGQLVFESSGVAYSNFALRPWDWRVTEAMVQAARDAGYGSDRYEADAQRTLWGPNLDEISDSLWSGRPYFYTAHYGYAKYHTMIIAGESGWPESTVARLKGLLRIGNGVWEGEPSPGYPVTTVKAMNFHKVVAWGSTAEQRRKSRVELWQKQTGFALAMFYSDTDCRTSFICATSKKAIETLDPDMHANTSRSVKLTLTPLMFAENLRNVEGINADAVVEFVKAGPERKVVIEIIDAGKADKYREVENEAPIENGLALRLRISYRNPELCDLRLNGHLLAESETDGYQRWFADGFTQVQINVPPEKSRRTDLYVVTCAYIPDEERSYGWRPPREVREILGDTT